MRANALDAAGGERRGSVRDRRRLLAAALALASGAWAEAARAAVAQKHRVAIEGLKYVPETLTVRRGDTIVWINNDPFPHTVTAAGTFDSGSLAAGKSWRFLARRAGTYPYLCTLHSNMKGSLLVE